MGIHPTVRLQKNAAGNCRNHGSQRHHNAVKSCTQRVPTSWWYTQAQACFINYIMFLVLFSNNSRNNSMAITFLHERKAFGGDCKKKLSIQVDGEKSKNKMFSRSVDLSLCTNMTLSGNDDTCFSSTCFFA